MVQHGLPSESQFNAQVAAGRKIYVERGPATIVPYIPSVNRNGFTSYEAPYEPDAYDVYALTLMAWWDDGLGKPLQANPSIGGAPVDYVP